MEYDLAVIGGGIVGAGVARDAALRGLKVVLIEKEDFGAGTTSRSTRLIHGGLRYLQHYDFALVHEALGERRTLLRIAPHLVRPLPFLFPIYRGRSHALPYLWAGMLLYDFLRVRRGVPHHRLLPPDRCLALEPTLRKEGLVGGFLYYDGQCSFPERLCLENVLDAAEHGAEIHNHTRAIGFLREGPRVRGVRVRDELTGTERDLHARLVLNCAGPWLDEVEQLADPQGELMLRRTKGVHLVVPPFTRHALILESEDRSRVVFAIPWNGHTLLGTTDTDHQGDNDGVHAEPDDVDYLLREVRSVLDVDLKRDDVRFTTAGLRPLQRLLGRSTAAVTRRERLIDHGDRPGLLTLVGGKITTYRNIAQVVVDEVQRKLGYAPARCLTAKLPLPGGRLETHWPGFVHDVLRESARHNVPPDVGQHLADHYGAEAFGLLEAVHHRPELGRRIAAEGPWIWAEVDHAVTMEMARTLSDVMLRRLSLGFSADQGRGVAPAVARFLADRLGWDAARQDAEVAAYEATLARSWAAPTP